MKSFTSQRLLSLLLATFVTLTFTACSDSIPAHTLDLEPLAEQLSIATEERVAERPIQEDAIWSDLLNGVVSPDGYTRDGSGDGPNDPQLEAGPLSENEFHSQTDPFHIPTPLEGLADLPSEREDLSSMRTVVKIFNGDVDAGITIPGFGGLKLGATESSMSVYYIESRVISTPEGEKVYGVGYSTHYLFKRLKRGIDVSDLVSVAASAQLQSSRTSVYYTLQTFGISSLDLVGYFKPTVNALFDVEGFGVIQSSIDGIHTVLSDPDLSKRVRFEPVELQFVDPADLRI